MIFVNDCESNDDRRMKCSAPSSSNNECHSMHLTSPALPENNSNAESNSNATTSPITYPFSFRVRQCIVALVCLATLVVYGVMLGPLMVSDLRTNNTRGFDILAVTALLCAIELCGLAGVVGHWYWVLVPYYFKCIVLAVPIHLSLFVAWPMVVVAIAYDLYVYAVVRYLCLAFRLERNSELRALVETDEERRFLQRRLVPAVVSAVN